MGPVKTTGIVDQDGILVVKLKTNLPPGEKYVTVLVEEDLPPKLERKKFEWPVLNDSPLTEKFSVSREDIYDDRGL